MKDPIKGTPGNVARSGYRIRRFGEPDLDWATPILDREFGGRFQARRGALLDVFGLPGFVAEEDGLTVGLLTYQRVCNECELAFVWTRKHGAGIGTILLQALREEVAPDVLIWVVTTNDNLDALRFFQRRGFALSALRPGAIDEARRLLKPQIPLTGAFGIQLRDELELQLAPEPLLKERPELPA